MVGSPALRQVDFGAKGKLFLLSHHHYHYHYHYHYRIIICTTWHLTTRRNISHNHILVKCKQWKLLLQPQEMPWRRVIRHICCQRLQVGFRFKSKWTRCKLYRLPLDGGHERSPYSACKSWERLLSTTPGYIWWFRPLGSFCDEVDATRDLFSDFIPKIFSYSFNFHFQGLWLFIKLNVGFPLYFLF